MGKMLPKKKIKIKVMAAGLMTNSNLMVTSQMTAELTTTP